MNTRGKKFFHAITALSIALTAFLPAQGADVDLRCWGKQLIGHLHSCPLVMTDASFEQTAILGKVRDTMNRLDTTLDAEQIRGRLTVAQANDLRTELDTIRTNMEDAVSDGTLTHDEAFFVVSRMTRLDNRADMLIASHPATQVAIDTDVDIRLRDLNGRLAEDVNAGLLTEPEADELRRTLAAVAAENARIEADRMITPAEQERLKIALDTVGARMDDLSTNSYVAVRSLFTWSDFEPRQQQLLSRVSTALDQGRISATRAAFLRNELQKVQMMAASINAQKTGGIIAAPDLIVLRQKQNLIDRQITEEIRIAARHRPAYR